MKSLALAVLAVSMLISILGSPAAHAYGGRQSVYSQREAAAQAAEQQDLQGSSSATPENSARARIDAALERATRPHGGYVFDGQPIQSTSTDPYQDYSSAVESVSLDARLLTRDGLACRVQVSSQVRCSSAAPCGTPFIYATCYNRQNVRTNL